MPSLLTAWRLSLILVAPVYSECARVCLSPDSLLGKGGPVGAQGAVAHLWILGRRFFLGQLPFPVLETQTLPCCNSFLHGSTG